MSEAVDLTSTSRMSRRTWLSLAALSKWSRGVTPPGRGAFSPTVKTGPTIWWIPLLGGSAGFLVYRHYSQKLQRGRLTLSAEEVEVKVEKQPDDLSTGEVRFCNFASLEWRGQAYMSPRDFLDSLIQDRPRPRIKRKLLSDEDVAKILSETPLVSACKSIHKSEDPKFLRQFADQGIISFPEYLFLLSVLTRPEWGFRVAFDLIDESRENLILKEEFSKFVLMASKGQKRHQVPLPSQSTLQAHFFGTSSEHKLKYPEFESFLKALQREVLKTEFVEYSRGAGTITEEDFACLLLRFADLTEREKDAYIQLLQRHLPDVRRGISFPELEHFFMLLNNLEDFSLAFSLSPKTSGNSLNKSEFSRAAKISLGGKELSDNLVDVVFALFDKAGDGVLSYDEFFVVLKNRLRRHMRRGTSRKSEWESFKQCVKHELSRKREL